MRVLTVARWYPSHDSPGRGSFVDDFVRATVAAGVDARVASFDRVLVGGSRREQRERTRAKARAAYDRVATPEALFVAPPSLLARGVPVARLPLVRRPGASDTTELLDDHQDALSPFVHGLVGQWRPDVIHAHTGLPDGIVAAAVGREHGIPIVVTEHASNIESLVSDPATVARYRTLLEDDVLLLAVSPSMALRLSVVLDVRPDRIAVLPNPVRTANYRPGSSEGRDPDTLLWVGSLGEHKGLDILLLAVAQLHASRPGLRLRLVGGERHAGDRARLESLAHDLGISQSVTFDGWLDRRGVADAMHEATVFVHPSPSESFGVVAAEAILAGLPVATRRSGGVPWIVERSGGFGAVADSEEPSSFAAAIEVVLNGLLAVDASAARNRLVHEFSSEVVANDAIAHYKDILERARPTVARHPSRRDNTVSHPSPTSMPRSCAGLPRILLATVRKSATSLVPGLPASLRARLVLVVPRQPPGAAPDGLRDLVELVEVDFGPTGGDRVVGRGPLRRLGLARGIPLAPRRPLVDAVLRASAGVRLDREVVEIVAIDAGAAALIARQDETLVRLAPGALRWFVDSWDAAGGQRFAEDSEPACSS